MERIQEEYPHLYRIDLPQKRRGWRYFISSWLYSDGSLAFLVDPGPLYSIDTLLTSLQRHGLSSLDYILLTHIHIDHAGGLARLLETFPSAKVCCHPRGHNHLNHPEKLWQGTQDVLGDLALDYGEILPVPAHTLFFTKTVETASGDIRVYETPGHAPHHLCFSFGRFLFCGEVAGTLSEIGTAIYQRPATPPRFDLAVSLASLEAMIALQPEVAVFAHYGSIRHPERVLKTAHHQLLLWTDVIAEQLQKGDDQLFDRVCGALLERDPFFAHFRMLPEDIRERELYFLKNTLAGMTEYIRRRRVQGRVPV